MGLKLATKGSTSQKKAQKTYVNNIYQDGELFDIAYPGYPGDIAFYKTSAKRGKVLYLGIGTGRIFSAVAEANKHALGIDNSVGMLKVLRHRYPWIRENQIRICDALEAKFDTGEFDTVIAPYSFLTHFEAHKAESLLNNIHKWLKPNGLFITDFFSPYKNPQSKTSEQHNRVVKGCRINTVIEYNHFAQKLTEHTIISKGDISKLVELHLNYYYPNELLRLFEEAHFKTLKVHGDFKLGSLSLDSDVMVFLLQRQK